MLPHRAIFSALVLLATGCATPNPGTREPQPGTPPAWRNYGESEARLVEANRLRCDSILEREYAPVLRSSGIEGVTYVWMFIDERGIVGKVQLHESSGHAELDEIALRAARCRRFPPALRRGVPTPVWISLPFIFRAGKPRTRPARHPTGDASGPDRLTRLLTR